MYFGLDFIHWLVILSALISVAGSTAYIKNTLKGETKPNRVTWFMWAFAPLIGTGAAISADADLWATVRIFLAGFLPLLIFLASFVNPHSYWKLTRFDISCGVIAVMGVLLWLLIDSPEIAILFAATADGVAALPTLRKAWKFPETETGITYIASLTSVLLVVPSIPVWDIENSAFQIYLLIINICLIFSVYRKRLLRSFRRDTITQKS